RSLRISCAKCATTRIARLHPRPPPRLLRRSGLRCRAIRRRRRVASRLTALGEFATLAEAPALAAANKRIRNILKKSADAIPATVDATLFDNDAERALHAAVDAAIADTDPLLADRDYVGVLRRLSALRPQVDAFFDGV